MNRVLVNFVAFQLGWFACVISAARGVAWIGLAVVALVIAVHLLKADRVKNEVALIISAVMIGFVSDSLLVKLDLAVYAEGLRVFGLAPVWILAMWALFSTTLNLSMAWLESRYLLGSFLGAILGPLSYLAGERLGAISFPETRPAMMMLALIWAISMPLLLWLAAHFKRTQSAFPPYPLSRLPARSK